jgi:DNA-binding NtrC family response regulator
MSTHVADLETVLLVDDEPGVRTVIAMMLHRAGYRVIEAGSGEEALARFEEHVGEIGIVISDVVMPGMHGPDVVQRLINLRPDLGVLFISGYAWSLLPAALMQHECVAFLAKPFTVAELVLEVRQLAARARVRFRAQGCSSPSVPRQPRSQRSAS